MKAKVHWSNVLSRVLAAVVGGYILSAMCAVSLSRALPVMTSMDSSEAVLVGTMMSFAIYVTAIVWVFSTSGARGAWIGLTAVTLMVGAAPWLIGGWGIS